MEYSYAESRVGSGRATGRRGRRGVTFGGVLLGILKFFFTLLVIGALTSFFFFRTFMKYVDTVLEPQMDIDASAYVLKQSSVIYYKDKESDRWIELQKIHGSENRTLVDYDRIPDHVVKALISIEDERFYEHNGVDWKSTARSVFDTIAGNNARGASTITQQLIKNLTGEKQVTIRRKILEIFRALRFHEKYSEKEILEMYFNLVYFGHNAYGISAAAETYFGKDVSELTVSEGAAIVGITQNPWKYDPLRSDWSRQQNRNRQLDVLKKMNDLGYLNNSEYSTAKNAQMVFVGDDDYIESDKGDETAASNDELDSFFVEQVFRDVVDTLSKERGYSKMAAQDLLYTGGYKIYCTLDPDIQEIVEEVYADRSNFDYTSEKGEKLQSGMTIINNETNNIVAIAGRVGEREGAFEWSYAASSSPCGSAIKPLSVYSPAIDAGIITAASVIDDYPVVTLNDSAWPVNAYSGYRGLLTIQDALRISSNTTAVRVFEKLTPSASYSFMTEKLGFTTLVNDDISSAGALALGGLTNGVSTIEMAAAYSTFANNGIYTAPRTFTEVRDSYGNIVIDNKQNSWVAMKETTVYTMNELLRNVMKSGGTGAAAAFSGMTMAGKTGTTNSRRDRYFVGYTPYYTAACWCGYPTPARINTNDNPSAIAWNKVMKRIHEGLPDKDFPTTSDGMVRVTVCNKTGLLAGNSCGSTRSVLVAQGTAPVLTCDAHTHVYYCRDGNAFATYNCPDESCDIRYVIDLAAPHTQQGFGYERNLILRPLSNEQYQKYSAQVNAGVRNEVPTGKPIYASDSETLLSDILTMDICVYHVYHKTPVEEPEPPAETDAQGDQSSAVTDTPTAAQPSQDETADPNNPVSWFENPLGPLETIDTNHPLEEATEKPEEDNSNARYLDDYLQLNDSSNTA